jgi:hypothetical protein
MAEFGGNSAILECGRLGDGPELPGGKPHVQPLQVAVSVRAAFHAVGQIRQHRMCDADPVAEKAFGVGALKDAAPAVDVTAGDPGIEQHVQTEVLPEIRGHEVVIGPTTCFSSVYFSTSLEMPVIGGGLEIRAKDQYFAISKKL